MKEHRTQSTITDQHGTRRVWNVYAVDHTRINENGEKESIGQSIQAFSKAAAIRYAKAYFGPGTFEEHGFETGPARDYTNEDRFEGGEEIAYIMCGWVTKED